MNILMFDLRHTFLLSSSVTVASSLISTFGFCFVIPLILLLKFKRNAKNQYYKIEMYMMIYYYYLQEEVIL